jgi:DNA-binding transcriptional LysR family regulator
MEIRQLKVFCAVVEKGSFSQAAEMLSLTQPTVSFQIASLEKELGTKLLDRSGREVTVTKVGEVLYQYSSRILRLTEEVRQAITEVQGLLKGELIMAASTIPGEHILPAILPKFREEYPGIKIALMITDTRGVIRKVMENEVEIGAVGAKEKNEKLVFTKFATDKLVLIVVPHNRWLKQDIITLEELRGVPFISRESGSGTRVIMKRGLEDMGIGEEELNIVMELGSTTAVKKAVEYGAGVSFVSEKAVENEIKLGLLKKVPVRGLQLNRDFFLVYKRQKTISPLGSAFLQFIREKSETNL